MDSVVVEEKLRKKRAYSENVESPNKIRIETEREEIINYSQIKVGTGSTKREKSKFTRQKEKKKAIPTASERNKDRGLGVTCAIGAALLFGLQMFFIHYLMREEEYSPFEQLVLRGYLFLIISYGGMKIKKESLIQLNSQSFFYLKMRIGFMVIFHTSLIGSLYYISASSMTFTFLIYSTIIPFTNSIFIHKRLNKFLLIPFIICIIAFSLVVYNSRNSLEEILMLFLVLSISVLYSIYLTLNKKYGIIVPKFTVYFAYSIPLLVSSSIILFIVLQPPSKFYSWNVLWICLAHSMTFAAQTAEQIGAFNTTIKTCRIIKNIQILVVFGAEILFYSKDIDYFNYACGIAIFIACLVSSICQKYKC